VDAGSIPSSDLTSRLVELNADYARVIDEQRLEAWPDFFTDPCLYKITTADNFARGMEAGLVYADSRGMLQDRVSALRQVNIYEQQRYRHIVGLPAITGREDSTITVETPFLVVRIMRTGSMDLFASGRYLDRVAAQADGRLKLNERIAVCDGSRFDTLLALPL